MAYEETEIKFPLRDPQAIRDALGELGGIFEGSRFENNLRLDDSAGSLTQRGMVLRLRSVMGENTARHWLTVKRPVPNADRDLSHRQEAETEISDPDALLAALAMLGYRPVWRYEKRRETYRFGGVAAEIDEMPYGWFLELEGEASAIRDAAGKLRLKMADGLTISYAQIFANVKRARKLAAPDLTFEAFEGIQVSASDYQNADE